MTEYYLAIKRNWNTGMSYDVDESWKHYAQWRKPDTKDHMWYDFMYMKRWIGVWYEYSDMSVWIQNKPICRNRKQISGYLSQGEEMG